MFVGGVVSWCRDQQNVPCLGAHGGAGPSVRCHVCVAVVGPPLTPAVFAVLCGTLNFTNVNTTDCGTSYADGAACAVRCNDGYTGSPVATCSASGSWQTGGNCTAGVQPLPCHVPFQVCNALCATCASTLLHTKGGFVPETHAVGDLVPRVLAPRLGLRLERQTQPLGALVVPSPLCVAFRGSGSAPRPHLWCSRCIRGIAVPKHAASFFGCSGTSLEP